MNRSGQLALLCQRYGIEALYAFGSRAAEVAAVVDGQGVLDRGSSSDADLGALSLPDRHLEAHERARLTIELEDLLCGARLDLILLPEAGPYLALDIVAGELLYVRDRDRLAEYELYVLRRAGDLARFERDRRQHILAGGR